MKNKISKILVIAFVLTVICLMINGYIKKWDVEENGKESIGKYVLHDSWGKGETNYFIFHIDGKKYEGNGGRAPMGFKDNIGKFYRIIYSEKHKGTVQAFFDEEVTDTNQILKAGFTKEDLKK